MPASANPVARSLRIARYVSHAVSAAKNGIAIPCIPMRLKLMSHRIVAVKNAPISPAIVPAICRSIRNIATMPATPNATATSRAVVMDTPAALITSATKATNIDGKFVNAIYTSSEPGSLAICSA